MNGYRWKHIGFLQAGCCVLVGALLVTAPTAQAALIVDDSWADGGRNNGADALDTNWWTSSTATGIEVSVGSMGMVTGSSGRGIHGIFPTQTLSNVGNSLKATYTFTTPATIGSSGGAFKVGLFDTLGRAGLDANIASSSSVFEPLYGYFGAGTAALPGYMLDMDVRTGTEDFTFREHSVVATATTPTGRLMGTNTGFLGLSPTGPDGAYPMFAANTTYTGSFTITRTSATEMELTATLGAATFSLTDVFDSASFGMLAFWANSAVFGTSNTPGAADNGIDFSNIKIRFVVPEASSISLALMGAVGALAARRRRAGVRKFGDARESVVR